MVSTSAELRPQKSTTRFEPDSGGEDIAKPCTAQRLCKQRRLLCIIRYVRIRPQRYKRWFCDLAKWEDPITETISDLPAGIAPRIRGDIRTRNFSALDQLRPLHFAKGVSSLPTRWSLMPAEYGSTRFGDQPLFTLDLRRRS